MSYTIYLVEDDHNLNDILSSYLKKEGWKVKTFFKGEPARDKITAKPDLWILDIMLPDIDGFQLI
ncbi:MAG: response regulator, partial [Halanaerobium sp.]